RLATTFAPLFVLAQNKTARMGSLSIGNQTLVINNNNGYGVDFTGATTLTGAATFSLTTATASNVVPGLTLSGVVGGAFATTTAGSSASRTPRRWVPGSSVSRQPSPPPARPCSSRTTSLSPTSSIFRGRTM